jgi:DNA segregation ATPase FtsK/SpoIIIE, S-DNA-T family
VVVVVDESHTYVQTVRRQFKEAAEENAWHLEQLVKKGRSVAMLTVLITQKQTGDAIPTAVRDVCQFSLSCACKTNDAAVAALGADIRSHAEVSPVRLVGREHVGVVVARCPAVPASRASAPPTWPSSTSRSWCAGRRTSAVTPPPFSPCAGRRAPPYGW